MLYRLYHLCYAVHKLLQLPFAHEYDVLSVIEHPFEYGFLEAQESQQVFFNSPPRDKVNDVYRLMLSQAVYAAYALLQYGGGSGGARLNRTEGRGGVKT